MENKTNVPIKKEHPRATKYNNTPTNKNFRRPVFNSKNWFGIFSKEKIGAVAPFFKKPAGKNKVGNTPSNQKIAGSFFPK